MLRGELCPGTRIPSSRSMAEELGLSRNVVLNAYSHLASEGYLETRHGSGTFVARFPDDFTALGQQTQLPTILQKAEPRLSDYIQRVRSCDRPLCHRLWTQSKIRYDFRHGKPAADLVDQRTWRRLIHRRAVRFSREEMSSGVTQGDPALREALATYLKLSRGVECEPAQIAIVNGSQQALDLLARLLVNPGDVAVVEEPCYPGARQALLGVGASVCPIRVDESGLVTDDLELVGQPVRLICVTPSHQYPSGSVMPLARRLALIAFARRVGAYIVEDDYDSEFRFDTRPEQSVQGLNPDDRVIYVGTLSKVLFPSLRLGYVVLPNSLVEPFLLAKTVADRYTALFAQGVLAEFIRDGHFERHIRRLRQQMAGRRCALVESLASVFNGTVEAVGESAGMHLLAWFPHVSREEMSTGITRAAENGVAVYTVDPCYTVPPRTCGLVMGYASMTPEEIRSGVAALGRALGSSVIKVAPRNRQRVDLSLR